MDRVAGRLALGHSAAALSPSAPVSVSSDVTKDSQRSGRKGSLEILNRSVSSAYYQVGGEPIAGVGKRAVLTGVGTLRDEAPRWWPPPPAGD